jgi:hypothetical protein
MVLLLVILACLAFLLQAVPRRLDADVAYWLRALALGLVLAALLAFVLGHR